MDYLFDVPVNLAKAVTGFRHDESELEFEVLEPAQAPDAIGDQTQKREGPRRRGP